jgi:mannose-6-phosphate isomerase-like protein (cupin superfamily)
MEDMDFGTVHHFSSGVYAKQMHLKKGYFALSHKHAYDHLSILASGVAMVEVGGEKTTYTAPACIEIKAGKHHQITAMEDVTWFCIHATDVADPELVDEVLIQKE